MSASPDETQDGAASGMTCFSPVIGSRLARASIRVMELEDQVSYLTKVHQSSVERLERMHQDLKRAHAAMNTIHASNGWKVLKLCYRARNVLLPPSSARRRVVAGIVRPPLRMLKALIKGKAAPSAHGLAASPAVLHCEPQQSPDESATTRNLASGNDGYARWILKNEPREADLAAQRRARFAREPRISILIVADGPGAHNLMGTLESVRCQTYEHWEICLVGKKKPTAWMTRALMDAKIDLPRCRAICQPAETGFAELHNAALAASSGDLVAVLHAGDALAPFALFEVASAFNAREGVDIVYSDEDRLSASGDERTEPLFKPCWSPDTLRGHNYIGDLAVFARALIASVGGFRVGFDASPHYDVLLRASEKAREIVHIPHVLYHRRETASGASPASAAQRREADRKALREHIVRLGRQGEVEETRHPGTYRVVYELPERPLVSIIIPNKDCVELLSRCISSIRLSTYSRHEIIVVENGSRRPETHAFYDTLRSEPNVKIIEWTLPFNYAALNNFAAGQCAGEVLLFLNNDMQVITPDWLERQLEHAQRPEVGAVGALLCYADNLIQHAGVILLQNAGPHHLNRFLPRDVPGYGNRLATVQNVTALTGACLMMRRAVFGEVGGFDERFVVVMNDLDLCLKAREKGYLNVWTPHAQLYHYESVSRGYDDRFEAEWAQLFLKKWSAVVEQHDPYFSPNLWPDEGGRGVRERI